MAKSLSSLKTLGEEDPKKDAEVSSRLRQDWNNYTEYLKSKGLKGHPSLDKNDRFNKEIDEYRKVNPNTTVTRESVWDIQKELSKYRDYSINELRNKRAMYVDAKSPNGRFVEPNENLDLYMKDLSKIDGKAGHRTTNYQFPLSYMKTFMNDKLQSVENKGFATAKN